MSFKTRCTNCQASYTLKSRDAQGKKIKCKKCGEAFVVRFAKKKAPAAPDDSEWDSVGTPPPMTGLPPVVGGARKKKKKKPSDEEDAPEKSTKKKGSSKQKNILIVVGLVAALGIFTGVIFAVGGLGGGGGGGGDKPLEQATYKYKRGTSGEHLFSIDYPVDWKFSAAGGSGGKPEWIKLEADGILVALNENLKASAMGDIAGAATKSAEELPDELKPIARVHEQLKSDMELNFDNYKEDPPEVIKCGLGEGRLSKFSGDEGMLFSSMAYGYRGTFPAGPEMVKVMFKFSSEKQFKRHEDVIRKMIASLGH